MPSPSRSPESRRLPEPAWLLDPPEAFEDPHTPSPVDVQDELINRYLDSLQ